MDASSTARDAPAGRPLKVCFVALYAYPVFNPRSDLIFGGSELRTATFAKALACLPDADISCVVRNHDGRRMERIDGVEVWRHTFYHQVRASWTDWFRYYAMQAFRRTSGFPYLVPASLHPGHWLAVPPWVVLRVADRVARRLGAAAPLVTSDGGLLDRNRFRVYREVDADVYCIPGVSDVAAELLAYCRAAGKRFVLLCGSDYDLSPLYYPGSQERNVYGSLGDACYRVLEGADAIVTQTERQAELLRERAGRESTVISNPIDLAPRASATGRPSYALWVGKSDDIKRPELLVELARRCPETRFVMVMNRLYAEKFDAVVAAAPENVLIIERVPSDEIEQLFARASMFISTSKFEGFPNTFLQAGKYALPILSLVVDPDGFIEREACGYVAQGDLDTLAAHVRELTANDRERRRRGAAARNYVERQHDLRTAAGALWSVLRLVARQTADVNSAARQLGTAADLRRAA